MMYVGVIKEDMFKDIVLFSFSEPGAMGPGGIMTFYKKTGESFSINYLSDITPYAELKRVFPTLQEGYWDGPMRTDPAAARTLIIGGSPEDRETCIPKGWCHIYLDFGNYLTVKKEFYRAVREIFKGKDNCDIMCEWTRLLDEAKFASKICELEEVYHEE